jgi:hypothetical protein
VCSIKVEYASRFEMFALDNTMVMTPFFHRNILEINKDTPFFKNYSVDSRVQITRIEV